MRVLDAVCELAIYSLQSVFDARRTWVDAGRIPGVLIAAYIVKSLPLVAVRWLVVIVVIYAAIVMLRSAAANRERPVGQDDDLVDVV